MIKRTIFLALSVLIFCQISFAQEVWSLQKCVEHAQTNSLTVKQADLTIRNGALTQEGAKADRLPNVNAGVNGGAQFGRTIDPTTNEFRSQNIGFNSFSLDAAVTLYNGGRINNTIEKSKLDISAAKADAQQIGNDIGLSVATAYLNILFAQEQIQNANNRLELTKAQLEQTNKLISAGTIPAADRLEVLSAMAQDEQAIITQENNRDIGYLTLKNILELPYGTEIQIETPPSLDNLPDIVGDAMNFESVYQQALTAQPQIRAGELRQQSADLDIKIAKAQSLPRLILFGGLSSNYSSQARDFDNPTNVMTFFKDPSPVVIDNEPAMLSELDFSADFAKLKYFDQLDQNFGQNIGLNLSIPIYNNGSARIAMERAELSKIQSDVSNQQVKRQLQADVQNAIASAKAAKKALDASEKSVEALEATYENTGKRYRLGAVNTFEYTTSKNNLDRAKVDLIVSKYDYLFKLKIVDYYQGKTLSLD